jgi:hypothetical protein
MNGGTAPHFITSVELSVSSPGRFTFEESATISAFVVDRMGPEVGLYLVEERKMSALTGNRIPIYRAKSLGPGVTVSFHCIMKDNSSDVERKLFLS